jgi:hypothetical protein
MTQHRNDTYAASHDPAHITITGLDYNCFANLLGLFQLYFYGFNPWTLDGKLRGQEIVNDAATCLTLALAYTKWENFFHCKQKQYTFCHGDIAGSPLVLTLSAVLAGFFP